MSRYFFLSAGDVIPKFISCPNACLTDIWSLKISLPFLNKLSQWRIAHGFKIQKYNPNAAYFTEHCENDGGVDGNMERRLIALMVYLNTVTDEGQTRFPTQNICHKIMNELSLSGSDILELGMPFSDPMADGPIIQKSSKISLE